MDILQIVCCAITAFFIGFVLGIKIDRRGCADAAIDEEPTKFWSDALIDARARKEKGKP